MSEMMKTSLRCAVLFAFAAGPFAGPAHAQETEETAENIQNVLLTFHLVEADGFSDDDPAISDVVAELRKIFNFEGYRLLSTSVLNVGLAPLARSANTLEGTGSQRIIPAGSDAPLTIQTVISTRPYSSPRAVRATVILSDVTVVRELATEQFLPLLEASVTMRDGQTMVLGTGFRSADEPVLILIVTPWIDPALTDQAPLGCEQCEVLRQRTARMTGDSEFANQVFDACVANQCRGR